MSGIIRNWKFDSLEMANAISKREQSVLAKAAKIYAELKQRENDDCLMTNLPEELVGKPVGISCPCKRCSPYSM